MRLVLIGIFLMCTPLWACDKPLRLPTELSEAERAHHPWPLIVRIFQEAKCTIIWVPVKGNTTRIFRLLEMGHVDVIAEASIRPERLQYARFSKPYRLEKAKLYVLAENRDNYPIHSLDDIRTQNWIIVDDRSAWLGNEWTDFRQELITAKRIIEATDPITDLRLLKKGMADMVAGTDGWELSTYTNRNGIVALPYTIHSENVHFMFNTKNVSGATVARIDAAIDKALSKPDGINK